MAAVAVVYGCGGPPAASSPVAASASASGTVTNRSVAPLDTTPADSAPALHLAYAQPKLPTVKLRLGAHELDAELCRTITQIATGLMFRTGIGPEDGMLFVFAQPHQPAFYMKNVPFDIDVAYLDDEGVITEIVRLKAQDRTPVPAKSDRVQFVLETAPDYFPKHGLAPGTVVVTDRGPLKATLVGR